MGLALGRLGWAPATFWLATPQELYAAATGRLPAAGLGAEDVDALRALIVAKT